MWTVCSLICEPVACSLRRIAGLPDWRIRGVPVLPAPVMILYSFMLGSKTSNMLTPGLALIIMLVCCSIWAKCDLVSTRCIFVLKATRYFNMVSVHDFLAWWFLRHAELRPKQNGTEPLELTHWLKTYQIRRHDGAETERRDRSGVFWLKPSAVRYGNVSFDSWQSLTVQTCIKKFYVF